MNNYLPKVMITGALGQLGQSIQHHAKASSYQLIPCNKNNLDITSHASIINAIETHQPDVIINAAAYTNVDLAEKEKSQTFKINTDGAKNMALIADQYHIPMIHLSTDYVFDGKQYHPYQEKDQARPLNLYGYSKWEAENILLKETNRCLILRVSGLFSEFGKNFVKTILSAAQTIEKLNIVADQITCPTAAPDIADAIFTLLNKKDQIQTGIYHYCSKEAFSWYDFASLLLKEAETYHSHTVKTLQPITSVMINRPAIRPAYSVLSCEKIQNEFGIAQPSCIAALKNVIKKIM